MCWESPLYYTAAIKHLIYVLWQSPPLGWFKINFDGSSIQQDSLCVNGFVINNYLGCTVVAKSFSLNGITVETNKSLGRMLFCHI